MFRFEMFGLEISKLEMSTLYGYTNVQITDWKVKVVIEIASILPLNKL